MTEAFALYWIIKDDLSDVQQQLSTGKKLLRPSDDPVGSAQVIRLTEEIDLIAQSQQKQQFVDQ
ncbi:hypothetical protein P4S73_07675 [Paraglaciecola sp. Hal342]